MEQTDSQTIAEVIPLQPRKSPSEGEHRVKIALGNHPEMIAAYCIVPRPDPEAMCWIGPDRRTINEAIADARGHYPDREPEVVGPLPW